MPSDACLLSIEYQHRSGGVGPNTAPSTSQIVMAFEDEFAIEIPDAEAEKIQTVEQAVAYLAAHPQVAPPPPMTQKRPDRIAGTLFSMRIVHSSLQRAAVTGVLIY